MVRGGKRLLKNTNDQCLDLWKIDDNLLILEVNLTRPDTRLPQLHAGWQVPYLRSLELFGNSSEAKDCKNMTKSKHDGPTT